MKQIVFVPFIIFLLFLSCTDENLVGVALKNNEELSSGDNIPFLLHQNYPNPFNPTTVIGFDVAINMKLELTVYTTDWVVVEKLFNDSFGHGTYRYAFNAKNIPSGDYFYVMEGSGFKIIRKMKIAK